MAVGTVDTREASIPIGLLRFAVFEELGPSWLRFDGETRYSKDSYPDFWLKASSASWIISGPLDDTFALMKVEAGTSLVASGFEMNAGELTGSDSVTLTTDHLPEHGHAYTDAVASAEAGKAGILSNTVPVLAGMKSTDTPKTTGMIGKGTPVPIKPLGFTAHLFVFAGRMRP